MIKISYCNTQWHVTQTEIEPDHKINELKWTHSRCSDVILDNCIVIWKIRLAARRISEINMALDVRVKGVIGHSSVMHYNCGHVSTAFSLLNQILSNTGSEAYRREDSAHVKKGVSDRSYPDTLDQRFLIGLKIYYLTLRNRFHLGKRPTLR